MTEFSQAETPVSRLKNKCLEISEKLHQIIFNK